MFALGVLSKIEGVEEVKLVGLPLRFTRCLSLQTAGQGGTVLELTCPTKTVKRQHDAYHKPKKVENMTRKYWQPMLDWGEFEQRNNIKLSQARTDHCFPAPEEMSRESLTNTD